MRGKAAAALALLCSCYDFDGGYNTYCEKFGCGSDGASAVDGGARGDAGASDAGARDSGSADAGPGPCLPWGAPCSSPDVCCNALGGPQDGGAGLGCSGIHDCEFRPQGCLPPGYFCHQDSDCCDGGCNGGQCANCGSAISNRSCTQAADCCSYNDAECSSAGMCVEYNSSSNNGAHCISHAFCSSGYCDLSDGGSDGVCAAPPSTCNGLDTGPFLGGTCCAGMTFRCAGTGTSCFGENSYCCSGSCDAGSSTCDATGPGDAGTCCLVEGQPCLSGDSCCSFNCLEGVCVQADAGGSWPVGHLCLLNSDCASGELCDVITGTCETDFCYPPQFPGPPGCGQLELNSTTVGLLDGGRCFVGGETCSTGTDCCSGVCDTIILPMGSEQFCGPVTFFY